MPLLLGSTLGEILSPVITGFLCDSQLFGGWPAAFYLFGKKITDRFCWSRFDGIMLRRQSKRLVTFFRSEKKQKVVGFICSISLLDGAGRLLRPLRPRACIQLVNVLESLDKSGNSKRVGKKLGRKQKVSGGGKLWYLLCWGKICTFPAVINEVILSASGTVAVYKP